MMIPILISLAALANDGVLEPGQVSISWEDGEAPELSEPAADLPMSLIAPEEGHWVGLDGEVISDGEFMPAPLNLDIRARLRVMDSYPDLCQAILDHSGLKADKDRYLAIQQTRADMLVERLDLISQIEADAQDQIHWRWYHTLAVVGAGVLTGVAGYGAHSMLAD